MGSAGERAHRIDGRKQHFDIGESLQYEEVHAALFERQGLLAIDLEHLFPRRVRHFRSDGQRPDGSGNQYLMRSGLAGFAGNLYAAMVDFGDLIGKAQGCELGAVGAKGIRLDDVGASLDIGLMNAKHGLRLRGRSLPRSSAACRRLQTAWSPWRHRRPGRLFWMRCSKSSIFMDSR